MNLIRRIRSTFDEIPNILLTFNPFIDPPYQISDKSIFSFFGSFTLTKYSLAMYMPNQLLSLTLNQINL